MRVKQLRSISPPYIVLFVALGLAVLFRFFPSDSWSSGLTRNYLAFHVVIEFVVIIVSFGVASVGLATFHKTRDWHIFVLSISSVAIGAFDFGHSLTFSGMPDFFGRNSNDKAIGFWLMSRGLGALTYAYIALTPASPHRIQNLKGLGVLIASSLAVSAMIIYFGYDIMLFHPLPAFFIPGKGLTPLKIELEWICVLLSALSAVLLFRQAERSANFNVRWMACACGLYAICGYFFTVYREMDDLYVFIGHFFKAFSALILYRAVFVECVEKPYARAEALAAEASAASVAKSRFLANVSHEFRTPLGVITGFSDLLLGSPQLDSKLANWTTIIARNARQLRVLIDDLLDLTKAEQEKIELTPTSFDLTRLLVETISAFEVQAKNKGLTLTLSSELNSAHLVTNDENRVRQVLMNLFSNSLKFTRAGEVVVEAKQLAEKTVLISIRDTGAGISEQDALRLFQPFSQLGDASRRTFGGTGLGLAVSRNLAELMGGSLSLFRSEPGRGSEFHFVLRSADDSNVQLQVPAKEVLSRPSFVNRRVLIAEDSPDNRSLLEFYLEPTGIQIDFGVNGREAIELATRNSYDLVLMDLQMPEVDGFEATQRIRASGWRGTILALTAHALLPERERALQNGFDGYLIKPISRTDLWKEMQVRLNWPL